jgi:hypothetical protein
MSATGDEPATDLWQAAAEFSAAYEALEPAEQLLIRELIEAVPAERARPNRPLVTRLLFANSVDEVRLYLGELASR